MLIATREVVLEVDGAGHAVNFLVPGWSGIGRRSGKDRGLRIH